ncbi:glycosyltransferase [Synechococcus sp. CBW1004]|uniref:glycosyltransferase family 2 protein n=1 Tax=Synechococcus sp. CBW1004 TaxID=1353136 RepID=UPI0018CED1A1|nr:cellulose synthase catalytic subunit [Synechococcus sp. CBW1004]QPN63455.1 glycosyltransferase [Synechococcus sp. CBW1004]
MRLPWAVALLLLLGLRYLLWRATDTLNLATPLAAAISVTALAAEALLIASSFLELLFSLWLPSGPGRGDERSPLPAAPLPWVEVLVPSYGEPPELIERCLRACRDLDYPRFRVWLLDDSGRPELEQLCADLGVRYLARQERRHAKAGNLNHALPHLQGELIAVFDADVLPLRRFLRRTVPLFEELGSGIDARRSAPVGFVQTPQTYRNADPVMRNLALERWLMPDEESFYRWIEPCREAVGAVVCAGTSFVMRREALERVGGFETGTPSEDLATGIRITAAGYRNHYLPEKLSAGLAPLTAAAMARQRCRWASGTLQVLRTGASPLTIRGLNPLQRLAYLEGIVHWLMPLPQLLLALMPLSLGVLGVVPLRLSGEGLLLHALPFALAQLLLVRWLSAHSRTALLPELYRWIFLLPLVGAVLLTLLGRPQRFRVTPKALAGGRRTSPARRLLLPLLVLLSLQVVSLLNLLRPAMGAALAPLSTATLTVSLVWAALNLFLLSLALRACFDRPGLAAQPWFRLRLPCRVHGGEREAEAELEAISEMGVELLLPEGWMSGFSLPEPPADGLPGTGMPEAIGLEAIASGNLEQPGLAHGMAPTGTETQPVATRQGALQPMPAMSTAPQAEGAQGDGPLAGRASEAIRPGQSPQSRPELWLDLQVEGLERLPLQLTARLGRRLGAHWGPLSAAQRQALFRFLYSRDGLWPQRKAPPEPLALVVVLQRWLLGCRPECWFRRSLIPQNPPVVKAG